MALTETATLNRDTAGMTYIDDIRLIATLPLPWQRLSGKNILVTGATGLIGSTLIDVLLSRPGIDYHVYASGRNEERVRDRFAPYYHTGRLHFIRHDITQPLQAGLTFHYAVHAASGAGPGDFATNPVGVLRANLLGTDHLLSYGVGHGLERLLFVSSGEVYGEGDGRVFTEDYSGYVDCATPRACYPSAKRAAETLCVSYAAQYGVDVVIARLSHVYGPHFTESDNRVYAQFIRNVLSGDDIVLKSAGAQFRSWCYVADAASALLHILLRGKCGEAYNVADAASNISIRQLAELTASLAGRSVRMEVPDEEERRGYNVVSRSVFSTARIEGLGWHPLTHIREGLEKTIQARRDNAGH